MGPVRLILFGVPDRDAALLEDDAVRSALQRVDAVGHLEGPPPPRAGVEAGLFARRGDRWQVGPRIYMPDPRDRAVAADAGKACAVLVAERCPALRTGYEQARAWDGPWGSVALLVVGGLLLDLFVGQILVDEDLVRPPESGWRAWLLPPAETSVGARFRYDPAAGAGCGVMWVQGVRDTVELLADGDLRALAARGGGPLSAARLLRLRYLGWLRGTRPAYVLLRAGDPLWVALEETARRIVHEVHRPLVRAGDRASDAHAVLARSRMVFEQALGSLRDQGVVPSPAEARINRFLWDGYDWTLRAASAGGNGLDAGR